MKADRVTNVQSAFDRRGLLLGMSGLTAAAACPQSALAAKPPHVAQDAAPAYPVTYYRNRTIDGINIFYREAGPKDAPVVLLLHGFPTSSHMFRNLIPALADRYHVIAPDYPGYGQSDMPDRAKFALRSIALASLSMACLVNSASRITRCMSWTTAHQSAGGWL